MKEFTFGSVKSNEIKSQRHLEYEDKKEKEMLRRGFVKDWYTIRWYKWKGFGWREKLQDIILRLMGYKESGGSGGDTLSSIQKNCYYKWVNHLTKKE